MNQEAKEILNPRRKCFVHENPKAIGNATEACKDFDLTRSAYYTWKKEYEKGGQSGFIRVFIYPSSISFENNL